MKKINQRIKVTENDDYSESWYDEAKRQKVSTVGEFIYGLSAYFNHTSISKVEAGAACALAAAQAFHLSKQGNFTKEESGYLMWEFIKQWTGAKNLCGFRLQDFSEMIYPANAEYFDKVLSHENWTALQELAQAKLEGLEQSKLDYQAQIKSWEMDLEMFIQEHPDYNERPEYYTKNITGTYEEIAKDEQRKRDGFNFAPARPVEPPQDETIINHWKSIVAGVVPFGYSVLPPAEPQTEAIVKQLDITQDGK